MNTVKKTIVGLTGGIGSGKSAAAKIFLALGVEVIDADALAREVVELGQPALSDIAAHFGDGILTTEGNLDRAALRSIVFSNPEHKSWLEGLLHPLIAELLQRRLDATKSPYAILESPLLLETEQHKLVQRVLVIDADEETQIARALRRDGGDEKTIRSIIASQINRDERVQRADDLVPNEASLEQLKVNIEALHSKYMEMVTE
ncbi:MAG: dephospho-CoA kinase [Gammaproteobacteria bacterium]|nr:dephospho-CoA kinase [Gammaproteobacteria bacterium]